MRSGLFYVRFFGKWWRGEGGGVEISAMMPQNQHFWAQKFANPQGVFVTLQQADPDVGSRSGQFGLPNQRPK